MRTNNQALSQNSRCESDRQPTLPGWGAGRGFSASIGTSSDLRIRNLS
jgi:hypothetical protein